MATLVIAELTFRQKRELIRNAERALEKTDQLLSSALKRIIPDVGDVEREASRGDGRLRHSDDKGGWKGI